MAMPATTFGSRPVAAVVPADRENGARDCARRHREPIEPDNATAPSAFIKLRLFINSTTLQFFVGVEATSHKSHQGAFHVGRNCEKVSPHITACEVD
jgi:hypothetical protein